MANTPMKERPLSPHLSIYKPMLTTMMSIMHRITGMGLYFGMALLVWWLFSAAHSQSYFDFVQGFIGSWFGRLVLFGFTWALVHHALGGLRHLLWDTGRGFDLVKVEWMARATIAGSITLTLLIWIAAYAAR
ncbi:MAG: succinate dehydrogenase, cytochrome b556 subunit [Anderseniella sp.]